MFLFVPLHVVMKLHDQLIRQHGGAFGLRDASLLDSALHMPEAQFGGEFLHTTIYEMAAAYGFHLCKNHPFLDGNKRTAYNVMFLFLKLNGFGFSKNKQEHYSIMIAVANGEMTKSQLAVWLETVTYKLT